MDVKKFMKDNKALVIVGAVALGFVGYRMYMKNKEEKSSAEGTAGCQQPECTDYPVGGGCKACASCYRNRGGVGFKPAEGGGYLCDEGNGVTTVFSQNGYPLYNDSGSVVTHTSPVVKNSRRRTYAATRTARRLF